MVSTSWNFHMQEFVYLDLVLRVAYFLCLGALCLLVRVVGVFAGLCFGANICLVHPAAVQRAGF